MSQDDAKEAAAEKAVEMVQSGMIVGLGSGTTAAHFIQALGKRCKKGLQIEAVASSSASAELAKKGAIPLLEINVAPHIDLTVDGADEVDLQYRMIKGGGGAHVREKVLAASSKQLVIIIDESKQVPALGKAKLPVEVLFFGSPTTRRRIEEAGFKGQWRLNADSSFFTTENGNLLFDIQFQKPLSSPEEAHLRLIQIPGVVDTGFFFNLVDTLIIGSFDRSVRVVNT